LLENVMIPALSKRNGAFHFNIISRMREEKQIEADAIISGRIWFAGSK